jgi:hypothetical protein
MDHNLRRRHGPQRPVLNCRSRPERLAIASREGQFRLPGWRCWFYSIGESMKFEQQSVYARTAASKSRAELKRDIADAQRKIENLNHRIQLAKPLVSQLEITAEIKKMSDGAS